MHLSFGELTAMNTVTTFVFERPRRVARSLEPGAGGAQSARPVAVI